MRPYRQPLDEQFQLLVFFGLARFRPVPVLYLGVQLGRGGYRQHGRADDAGAEPVKDAQRVPCAARAVACAADARKIEDVVFDSRLVEPAALRQDVGGGVAFAHERQRLVVARLNADRDAGVPAGA